MLYNANNSFMYYNDNLGIINDYYQNIVAILKNILNNNPELQVNVLFCDNYNFNNNNKTLVFNINYEHTLVKIYGRSVPHETPFGNIKDDENNTYFVRIKDYDLLHSADLIIDYSNPNIHNVKSCPQYESFSNKHIYISASMYQPYFEKENRDILTLTTFISIEEPRRAELIKNLARETIQHKNIHNCFQENEMQHILQKTKILINIHQTPHHHTFEELRVLPALRSGVIVISETSPLIETIPYGDMIIWASYDNIVEKTKEVIHKYDFFYDTIFSKENIDRLCSLKKTNYDTLRNSIVEKLAL